VSKTIYEHCCEIGRYGGLSKSEKKRAAARRNIAKARKAMQSKRHFALMDKAKKTYPKWQSEQW